MSGDHIDVVARDHLSDNEIDWSVVPDSEISKYTQPDKIGEHSVIEKAVGKIDTDFGSTSVVLVATEVLVGVGSVRKNIDDTFVGDKSTVILDDTPIVPPTLVYSKSVNNLANAFDFGVVMIKTKEWFYTLGYAGVLLTDTKKSNFWYILGYVMSIYDKRIDGIATADSFDIRMVDGLPTQKNTDCGIFVTVFAEYMIEGIQIPASVDDIDSIRSRYGVLLWQYGKIKQKQRAISDDLLEDRKKN
ncbi:hypothetical protein P3L10_029649 [Capsicum annuum]